jgi:hypothetical protein
MLNHQKLDQDWCLSRYAEPASIPAPKMIPGPRRHQCPCRAESDRGWQSQSSLEEAKSIIKILRNNHTKVLGIVGFKKPFHSVMANSDSW